MRSHNICIYFFIFTVTLKSESFSSQLNIERIDLRHNQISNIEGGTFYGLNKIKEIYLGGNKLNRLNSDVFLVSF